MGRVQFEVETTNARQQLKQMTLEGGVLNTTMGTTATTLDKVTKAGLQVGNSVRNLAIGYMFTIFAQERLVESLSSVGQSLLNLNATMVQATFLAQDLGSATFDALGNNAGFAMAKEQVAALMPQYLQLAKNIQATTGQLGPQNIALAQMQVFQLSHPGFDTARQQQEQVQMMKDQIMGQKLQLATAQLSLIENQRIAQLSEQILEWTVIMASAQIGYEIGAGTGIPGAGAVGALGGLATGGAIATSLNQNFNDFQNQFNSLVDKMLSATSDNTSSVTDLTSAIKDLTAQLRGPGSTNQPSSGNNGAGFSNSTVWASGSPPYNQQSGAM